MSLSATSMHFLNTSSDGHCHPGQSIPVFDNTFFEEIFPNIQPKLPWRSLRPFPLVLLLVPWEKRPIPTLLQPPFSCTSFQVVVDSSKVSPESPLLWTKQPQFPQLLFLRLVLWTFPQLCCSSLEPFQHLGVFLVVKGLKLSATEEINACFQFL